MLIQPPFKSAIREILGTAGLPLGLAYLASVLKDHEIKIVDSLALNYGMNDIEREIKNFDPAVVGITATTPMIYGAYKTASMAKENGCKVILGGPHATFMANEILEECPYIDIVVRGEGEKTIKELMNGGNLKNIRGTTFRKNGKIIKNENRPFIQDLDSIPFPAYHLLPMDKYEADGQRFGMILTSRGCPFNCNFCSSSKICGKKWRSRSPSNVIQELQILRDEYGTKEIEFMDDTFTLDNKRADEICDRIIEEKMDISWTCSSRVNTITKKLASKLKKAGCHTIYLGIESGSQRILDKLGKAITIQQAKNAVKIVKEAGLNALGSFIIGIPGETIDMIKKTIKFAKKLRLDFAQFTLCTPYPGTKLFEMAKKNGLFSTKDWSKYTTLDPVMKIGELTQKQLKNLLYRAYMSFYLRPSFLFKQLRERRAFLFKKVLSGSLKIFGGRNE